MPDGRGLTILDPNRERSATAFVADRRLGLTADRTRVVDYYSTEAAFLFRAPGKPVTVEEAERYGINAQNPFSPKQAAPAADPAPEAKADEKADDKAFHEPVRDKAARKRR